MSVGEDRGTATPLPKSIASPRITAPEYEVTGPLPRGRVS